MSDVQLKLKNTFHLINTSFYEINVIVHDYPYA